MNEGELAMKIALLSPIAWRTPPRHYGPWERVVSLLCEGLVEKGIDVTLFATKDSQTRGKLDYICPAPYEEDKSIEPKVWECLHIAHLFEQANQFDLIHNHFDFLPLSYSRLVDTPIVTTIHGFSSPRILPVYQQYADRSYYVSISNADRHPTLNYIATVYHGIDLESFTFQSEPGNYLLYFGRIHPDKGAAEAIRIAKTFKMRLVMAGIIQDDRYFEQEVTPHLDGEFINYVGSVGPGDRDRLLGGAYALVHPIAFAEPFGLSVVEAMACGTPVVAFARGSMPEVIRDGNTGFLVESVEEAVEALTKIPAIERIACRQWVEERFSQERMVNDYLKVYEKVLELETAKRSRAQSVWGKEELICDEGNYRIRRLTIKPGQNLKWTSSTPVKQEWMVVQGAASLSLKNQKVLLKEGESINLSPEFELEIASAGVCSLVMIVTEVRDT